MNQPDQSQPSSPLPSKEQPKLRKPKNREFSKPQQMRAIVLNESGQTVPEIAKELELTDDTVRRMLAGKSIVDPSDIEKAKAEFCKDLAGLIYKILKHTNKEEFVKELVKKGKDAAVVLGIATEKLQLLTGKPTQITDTNNTLAEAEKKLKELSALEDKLNAAIPKATGNN